MLKTYLLEFSGTVETVGDCVGRILGFKKRRKGVLRLRVVRLRTPNRQNPVFWFGVTLHISEM